MSSFSLLKPMGAAAPPSAALARPAAGQRPLAAQLRQRQPGLAALTQRHHAAACRCNRCGRGVALRTSAVANTDKREQPHPYFTDEWKEYNRQFQRPVRARLGLHGLYCPPHLHSRQYAKWC